MAATPSFVQISGHDRPVIVPFAWCDAYGVIQSDRRGGDDVTSSGGVVVVTATRAFVKIHY